MKVTVAAALLFFALCIAPPSAWLAAQTEPPLGPATTESHLAEMSTNLSRIAELLELQVQSRKLDLVIRRVDLTQRLEPIEARLRQLRASRDGYAEERFRLRKQLENMAEQYASGTLDIEASEISVTTDYLESELELAEERLRTTDNEITTLENEAARYRREVEDWQAWVDRELADL